MVRLSDDETCFLGMLVEELDCVAYRWLRLDASADE